MILSVEQSVLNSEIACWMTVSFPASACSNKRLLNISWALQVVEVREAVQKRVELLERTLVEMEATDALRDRASAVLKEEIAEMRRRELRGRVDLTYVKSVRPSPLPPFPRTIPATATLPTHLLRDLCVCYIVCCF